MLDHPAQGPKTRLLDVQNTQDERGIALLKVGISNVDFPMQLLEKGGKAQWVQAKATFTVGLEPQYKGTHMSRFVELITDWSRNKIFSVNLREFLEETKRLLKAPSAHIDFTFKYFIDKAAPVSGHTAPMGYDCRFMSRIVNSQYQFVLGVDVPMSTLCPCSKAISDFGAHNQRAITRVQVIVDPNTDHPVIWIEDIVKLVDRQASCPVFPLLKREDEKWVTERQYTNAKFVEDVTRDVIAELRQVDGLMGYAVEVEALESIHGHNAITAHEEKFDLLPLTFRSED